MIDNLGPYGYKQWKTMDEKVLNHVLSSVYQ